MKHTQIDIIESRNSPKRFAKISYLAHKQWDEQLHGQYSITECFLMQERRLNAH